MYIAKQKFWVILFIIPIYGFYSLYNWFIYFIKKQNRLHEKKTPYFFRNVNCDWYIKWWRTVWRGSSPESPSCRSSASSLWSPSAGCSASSCRCPRSAEEKRHTWERKYVDSSSSKNRTKRYKMIQNYLPFLYWRKLKVPLSLNVSLTLWQYFTCPS